MQKSNHPSFIQIETNIACNANCPFCPQKEVKRKPGIMKDEVWRKIIDETRNLGITYRPFLINEPLTDKRMAKIIRYIKKDDSARTELNTNGALMTSETAEAILDAGIDSIRFSIDGFSEETFSASRVGLNYNLTVERTLRFIELASQKNSSLKVEVRMIGLETNRHEQDAFKKFWMDHGAVPVITSLYRWPWEPGVAGVQLPCLKILNEMFFYVDGRATLCCWDTHERAVTGDVNKTNTLDIWNGAVNQKYRDLLALGQRDQILLCSKCEAYKDRAFDGFPRPVHHG